MHEQAAFLYLKVLDIRSARDQVHLGRQCSEWELWQQDLRLNAVQRFHQQPARAKPARLLLDLWRRLKVHFRS